MSAATSLPGAAPRIALLCSFNLDLAAKPIVRALAKVGLHSEVYLSGYGQWQSDILNAESGLYVFQPSFTVLFLDAEDVLPSLAEGGGLPTFAGAEAKGLSSWATTHAMIQTLLAKFQGSVMCHTLVAPPVSPLGLLEGNSGYSHSAAIAVFNRALLEFASKEARIIVFDYESLVLEQGYYRFYDRRLWHLGRMRLSHSAISLLAEAYARYFSAQYTPRKKCLVLDLDNTLWGGVLGEDGQGGIQIGHSGLGLAFREFQLAILALYHRGIILAIASKNSESDALSALREHPDMVLRPEHFATAEIHWNDKPESLRRIAEKLNIGRDSLVFWDDSPMERGMVKSQLPEVLVPDVPADPSEYALFLQRMTCFDVVRLTEEDRHRGQMYKEQAERDSFLSQSAPQSLEDYYASLGMVLQIEPATEQSIARIAQLTQKTNQLNLTTKRYTEADIRAKSNDSSHKVYGLSLHDRFGDLGLIGAAILEEHPSHVELDTFLMSCRALGRRVEESFASFLANVAARSNKPLLGEFLPTKKNAPMKDLLTRNGWLLESREEASMHHKVAIVALTIPSWIKIVVP